MRIEHEDHTIRKSMWAVFMLAAWYVVLGKLALVLAISPGYAAPIWPGAGLALGFLIVFGPRASIGVFLGSLLVNIWTSLESSGELLNLSTVFIASGIAVGSTLQALWAYVLWYRLMGPAERLDSWKTIARFMLLVAPASCVVAASVAMYVLSTFGAISPEHIAYNWTYWCIGDLFGLLLFTPVTLIFIALPREYWRPKRQTVALPALAAMLVCGVIFYYESISITKAIRTEFEAEAKSIGSQLNEEIVRYTDALLSIRSFYESSNEVDRQEFRIFTARYLERFGGIQALSWIPKIAEEQRLEHEKSALRDGLENYTIREKQAGLMQPSGKKNFYYPVYFIEPLEGNEVAVGFDLSSNESRRRGLELATTLGSPVATDRITLAQETGNQFGILVILAIYKNGTPLEIPQEREKNLVGFVTGVFRMGDMLRQIQRKAATLGIEFILLNADGQAGEKLLLGPRNDTSQTEKDIIQDFQNAFEMPITFAEKNWKLYFQGEKEIFEFGWNTAIWWLTIGQLILPSLLITFLLIITGKIASTEEIVWEKTADLESVNKNLIDALAQREKVEAELIVQASHLNNSRLAALNLAHDSEIARKEATSARQELETREAELERSNAELDQFAYVASHDLKAPLRAVENYAAWIEKDAGDVLPEKSKEHLGKLLRRASQMKTLLDDLLSYSRVGRKEGETASIETQILVSDVVELLSPPESFHIQLTDKLPTLISPRAPLEQVFRNLIGNALKHHDKEDGHIVVDCVDKNSFWEFSIEDDGPGIPQEFHTKIFEMFQTLKPKDQGEGTGMGLAFVRKVVEQKGGSIAVDSSKLGGTVFRFTWPKEVR